MNKIFYKLVRLEVDGVEEEGARATQFIHTEELILRKIEEERLERRVIRA